MTVFFFFWTFLFAVLLKFESVMGRRPKPQSAENDRCKILELKKEVLQSLDVKEDYLKDDFARSVL